MEQFQKEELIKMKKCYKLLILFAAIFIVAMSMSVCVFADSEEELQITNNTGMFKAVSAKLVTTDSGSSLVFALSGSGYHELFVGTYEEAVANGDQTDNWIHGAENAEGKWEFVIPLEAGKTYYPIVAISNSYYTKYQNGQNDLERAFYPRQFVVDPEAKTLVTGDYDDTYEVSVVNNVSMFKPGEKADLRVVGGPNSNNYSALITLHMGSDSFDKVKSHKYTYTGKTLTEGEEVEISLDENKQFVEVPVLPAILKGESITLQFHSKKNDKWYDRVLSIDLASKTATFDEVTTEEELEITNNTGMFKAVSAKLVTKGSKSSLVFALSGSGYHELFSGTYEEAVANGDQTDNWIHGAENAEGKWQFEMPLEAGKTYYPVVAISNSYYEKYQNGKNDLERAFYPRQFVVDPEAKTLVTGDYDDTYEVSVVNNVSMFKPGEKADLRVVGGPNSNNYSALITLHMGSDSFDKVKSHKYTYTGKTLTEGEEVEISLDENKQFVEVPVLPAILKGESITLQFHSKKNDKWYDRVLSIDLASKTAEFNPTKEEQAKKDAAAAVEEANSIDTSGYTAENAQAIKDAVDALNALVQKEGATAEEINAAIQALKDAEAKAKSDKEAADKQAEEEAKEEAVKDADSAVKEAEKIDKTKYSAESYAKVVAAADALKKVMEDPNATAEQIAAAKTALDNAMKGLKAKAAPAPVKKKANTMKVTPVKKTFKAKKLKKKAKTFKAVKVKKAKGKVTYIGKPSGKKAKKFLKFNKKTGKITVKKGAKKGKYVMKVTVKAAGNATYKSAVKQVKVVVTVK